jgi:hypothetical protein
MRDPLLTPGLEEEGVLREALPGKVSDNGCFETLLPLPNGFGTMHFTFPSFSGHS